MIKKSKKTKKQVKKPVLRHEPSFKKALELIKAGNSNSFVEKELIEYRKGCKLSTSKQLVNTLILEAKRTIHLEYAKDKESVVALHLERYNREIQTILDMDNPFQKQREFEEELLRTNDFSHLSESERSANIRQMVEEAFGEVDYEERQRHRIRLINAYHQALATMNAKERVLGMHTKGFQISVVNRLNIEVKEKPKYDFSKLTFEDEVDFLHLILKAKKTDFEAGSVILRQENKEQETTIDIIHEVVEDVPNVALIKHEEKPPEPQRNDNGGAFNVNLKLMETLKRKAEEAFKQAGSKIKA